MFRKWLCCALLLAACAPKNKYVAPSPPTVTVATPTVKDVIDYREFTGNTRGHRVVEIRCRVRGFLKEIRYEPGTEVKKDDILFELDQDVYQAAVESAAADLKSAQSDLAASEAAIKSEEAALALAETAVKKLEQAYKSRAVAEIQVLEVKANRDVEIAQVEQTRARRDVAKAGVSVAQAKLDRANLDLGFTRVKAPMAGVVAMWNIERGSLVEAGSTLLTTMVNTDKIFAYFNASERWIEQVRKQLRKQLGRQGEARDLPVFLALMTDEGFPHKGRGDYVDPEIDSETGTLRLRAVFDNESRQLMSGAFVRIRIPMADRKGAILITERALGNDQSGTFVLTVNDQGVVERRDLEIGARHGQEVVVLKGLKKEDRVIVSGLQRARPGAKVTAETASEKKS